MWRYTHLSNGFSRTIENHDIAVALTYFAYNFIRIHRSLRRGPAMPACISDHLWSISELVDLSEAEETAERGAA